MGIAEAGARSLARGGARQGTSWIVKITRFRFDDHGTDWHLEETAFDPFNLLVGVSGVGKTKILEALRRICRMATESATSPGTIEWLIEFEHDGRSYKWEGLTGAKPSEGLLESVSSEEALIIVRESFGTAGEAPLIERDGSGIKFRGQTMPPLAELGSALHILKSEKELWAVHQGFSLVTFSTAASLKPVSVPTNKVSTLEKLTKVRGQFPLDLRFKSAVRVNGYRSQKSPRACSELSPISSR